MADTKKVVGSYTNEREAINAVEKLRAKGYRAEDISVITKNKHDRDALLEETGTKTEEGMATGAATGGLLGGLTGILAGVGALAIPGIGPIVAAGPIAAALAGAAVGAGAGTIAGALIGMGIPENEAALYEEDVRAGNILVLVDRKPDEAGFNIGYAVGETSGINGPEDGLNPGEVDREIPSRNTNAVTPSPDVNIDSNRPLNEQINKEPYASGYADDIVPEPDRAKFDAKRDNPFKD